MQEFQCFDLTLCAWLRAEGITLMRTERHDHSVWFIWDDTGGCATRAAKAFRESEQGRHAYRLIASYRAMRSIALDGRAA